MNVTFCKSRQHSDSAFLRQRQVHLTPWTLVFWTKVTRDSNPDFRIDRINRFTHKHVDKVGRLHNLPQLL